MSEIFVGVLPIYPDGTPVLYFFAAESLLARSNKQKVSLEEEALYCPTCSNQSSFVSFVDMAAEKQLSRCVANDKTGKSDMVWFRFLASHGYYGFVVLKNANCLSGSSDCFEVQRSASTQFHWVFL